MSAMMDLSPISPMSINNLQKVQLVLIVLNHAKLYVLFAHGYCNNEIFGHFEMS